MSTVAPIVRPKMIIIGRFIIVLPVETADTLPASPANWPTTIRSTAPYIACKNSASMIGTVNRISGLRIGPSVKAFLCSVVSTGSQLLQYFCTMRPASIS